MSIRDTPTTYSVEEAERIRELASERDAVLHCPRCSIPMERGPRVEVHGMSMQEVCCPECQRCVMLRNLPEA